MNVNKKLEWFHYDDGLNGFYAKPYGIKWQYSIIKHKIGKVEFAILDHNYEYIVGFPKYYQSFNIAKNEATKHYSLLLTQITS